MRYSSQVKPISYLKANAADVLEQTQETLALLKVLALGAQEVEEGRVLPAREFVKLLRGRVADDE